MELRINDALDLNKNVPEEPNQINSNQVPDPGPQRQLVDVFNRIEKKEQYLTLLGQFGINMSQLRNRIRSNSVGGQGDY